jgi:hypothetical protein
MREWLFGSTGLSHRIVASSVAGFFTRHLVARAELLFFGGRVGAAVGSFSVIVILVLLAAALYMLPWLIASRRGVPNVGSVFVVNFFLGWSLIGWVVALAMAVRSVPSG